MYFCIRNSVNPPPGFSRLTVPPLLKPVAAKAVSSAGRPRERPAQGRNRQPTACATLWAE